MVKIIFGLGALLFLLSCQQEQKELSQAAIKATVDSIIEIRQPLLQKQATEDLDRRKSIEIKAKADSILLVRSGKHVKDSMSPPDNTLPNRLPQP